TNLRTTHVSFHTHWSMAGDTLHLHREFTTVIDTAICSGAIRSETAGDLARIRQTYNYGAALAPVSTGKPMASLDARRLALLTDGVAGFTTPEGHQTRGPSAATVPENNVASLYGPETGILPRGRSEITPLAHSAPALPEAASAGETAQVYARL